MDNNKKPVNIQITYCVEWGFLKLASSMAAAIEDNLGLTVRLVEGHNGIFGVTINGETLFNNSGICSRRPETGDIIKSIQAFMLR